MIRLHRTGLPHSEISGSKVICTYPKLIAAYHVLHRLPEPRHPPFALVCFFYIFFARVSIYIRNCITDVYLARLYDLYPIKNTAPYLLTFLFTFNMSKIFSYLTSFQLLIIVLTSQ